MMVDDEYDIEKVNKTPWTIHEQWYSHPGQNDQLLFNIKDADGYFIASISSKDTALYIIHCVNEHKVLEQEPVTLCFHATTLDRVESIQEKGLLINSDPSYFTSPTPYVMLSEKPWWSLHGDDTAVFAIIDPAIKREYFDDPEGLRWPKSIKCHYLHLLERPAKDSP